MRTGNKSIWIARKRLEKDLIDYSKSPLHGIGVAQFDNDFLKYIINMQLLDGPYKGLFLQLSLDFPETYPITPPKWNILPGQGFTHLYHHHVYDEKGICFDLWNNNFLKTTQENTGWTSSYNLTSLLLQVQIFLSDPDIPEGITHPTESQIKEWFQFNSTYSKTFINEESKEVLHTWNKPYPLLYYMPEVNIKEKKSNIPTKTYDEVAELKENLTCSVLKVNNIDDNSVILGYPISQGKDHWYYPIPEMLSYEAFVNHIQNDSIKWELYFHTKFKSSMGNYYNCWFPIYLNENHYWENKNAINNALTILVHGASGHEKHDFSPKYIFSVFPKLLNRMIYGLLLKTQGINEAIIRCYYHFILLFSKLMDMYKSDFDKYNLTMKIGKAIIGGNSDKSEQEEKISWSLEDNLMWLLFSKNKDDRLHRSLWLAIIKNNIKETMAWVNTKHEWVKILKNQKLREWYQDNRTNVNWKKEFFEKDVFKHWNELHKWLLKNTLIKSMFKKTREMGYKKITNETKKFPDNLVRTNIYTDDENDDFFGDSNQAYSDNAQEDNEEDRDELYEDYEYYFKYIKERFISNQKENIFEFWSYNESQYLYDWLQENHPNLHDYIDINEDQLRSIQSLEQCTMKELTSQCNEVSKKWFCQFVFGNNIKSKLWIIIYITKRYFSDNEFMKVLELNCGVWLQDQMYECWKEIKNQLEGINGFKCLFNYIGRDGYIENEFNMIRTCF